MTTSGKNLRVRIRGVREATTDKLVETADHIGRAASHPRRPAAWVERPFDVVVPGLSSLSCVIGIDCRFTDTGDE